MIIIMKETESEYEELFASKKQQRDIEECRKCHFFSDHGDGTFCCRNVSHFFGHPWCFESRYPLKKEWFEKATINFQYRDLCFQKDDGGLNKNNFSSKGV